MSLKDEVPALPAHQERTEPPEPLNIDGESLHTGDDDRIDCATGIRAAIEEAIEQHSEMGEDVDGLRGALEDCDTLDKLLIETIAREREAKGAPARAAEWQPLTKEKP